MIETSEEQRDAAQWFRHRGLPAVVRGRPDNLLVRALPPVVGLALYDLIGDLLAAADGDSQFDARMQNNAFAAAYLAGLAALVVLPGVGAWLTARRVPRWSRRGRGFVPALLGMAAYVVAMPFLDHAADHGEAVLPGVLANLAYVLAALALVAVGAGAIFTWALRAALRQLREIGTMSGRALPLLILVATFEFFTAEIWQLAALLHRDRLWQIMAFFAVVTALFLLSTLSAELRAAVPLSGTAAPADLPAEHPFRRLVSGTGRPDEPSPPLTRLERANMVFVLMATQALQALVFGMLVFLLFTIFGDLAVPREAIKAWTNRDPLPGTLFGVQIPVTNELLQVSMFIAAFSTLYFVVTTVTDAGHRKAFLEPVLEHLRVSIAARALYLARYGSHRMDERRQRP